MALNLTPRSYHVDPTGKDFTLDPAPLLRAQERNFASQKETMQMVYETGRKGVEFAEYLGARQQLGRVKAQVSDLDPNDPDFARRYSSIVMDNPLAFTNEKTAPTAKMALVPLAAAATQASKHRYDMEELVASYPGKIALQQARSQGQIDVWQRKRDLAPPTAAQQAGLEPMPSNQPTGVQVDLTATPAAQGGNDTPVIPFATDGPDPSLFPQNATGENPPQALLLPSTEDITETPSEMPVGRATPVPEGYDPTEGGSGDLGASQAEAVAMHQEAAAAAAHEAAPAQAAPTALPPGVQRANDGTLWEKKTIGEKATWARVEPQAPMPAESPAEGNRWSIKTRNRLNQPTEWEEKPLLKRTAEERKALDDRIMGHLSVNPQLMTSAAKLAGAKTTAEELTRRYNTLKDAKDYDNLPTEELAAAGKDLSEATSAHGQLEAALRDQWMTKLDPEYAAEIRQIRADAATEEGGRRMAQDLVQSTAKMIGWDMSSGEADITETPAPKQTAAAAPSVAEQLRQQDPRTADLDKSWTSEKVFALKEAKSLASRLGLTEDALIKAVESEDTKTLELILTTARQRGVISPLVRTERHAAGGKAGASQTTTAWVKSKVGQNYLEVLRRAIEDPSVHLPSSGGGGATSTKNAWKVGKTTQTP